MSDQRILRNTSVTLSRTFEIDGTATDADGDVTVTITDEAGDEVVATTNATSAGSGVYTYLLAPQSQLNRLTVTWSGDWSAVTQSFSDYVEVIGGHLFTESEARAVFAGTFSSEAVYADAAIAEARDRIADEFEQLCGVSFVPRYERERLTVPGGYRVRTRRPRVSSVIAVTDKGTAVTVGNFTTDPVLPRIERTSGTFTVPDTANPFNVIVEYEHGYPSPPPDIKRAALTLLRHQLLPDETGGAIADRMLSLTNEFGNMRVSQPDARNWRPYGIPSVDTTLFRYRHVLAVA